MLSALTERSLVAMAGGKRAEVRPENDRFSQVINLMSNDARRYQEATALTNYTFMTPLWLLLAMAQLVGLLGASGLLGCAVMVAGLAANKYAWAPRWMLNTGGCE